MLHDVIDFFFLKLMIPQFSKKKIKIVVRSKKNIKLFRKKYIYNLPNWRIGFGHNNEWGLFSLNV